MNAKLRLSMGAWIAVLSVLAVFASANAGPASKTGTPSGGTIYLFHDPQDQDAECRAIYSLVDQAEKRYAGHMKVLRPDVENERDLARRLGVVVLPTVVILDAKGNPKEKIAGEGEAVERRLQQAFDSLEATRQ